MNPANETAPRAAEALGDAAADLAENLGNNAARLVGGVMSDAVQVSRRWHGLSLVVTSTYLRAWADAAGEAIRLVTMGVNNAKKK